MNTNGQFFRNLGSTSRANLARVAWVYFDHFAPGACSLDAEGFEEHTPGNVRDGLTQMSVFYHPLYVQFFNIDRLVGLDVLEGGVVDEVPALIADLFMDLGNGAFRFGSSAGTPFLPAQGPLPSPEFSLTLPKEFWILDPVALGVGQKGADTDIQADIDFNRLGEIGSEHIVAGKAYEPVPGRCSSNGYGFDLPFNRAGEKEFEAANPFNMEISPFKLPSGLLQREGVIPISAFEAWKTRVFTGLNAIEKSLEGPIEPLNHILKNLGADLFELGGLGLQCWQFTRLLIDGNGFSPLPPQEYSLLKGEIIKRTATRKPLKAISLDLLVYLGLVLERLSHGCSDTLLIFDVGLDDFESDGAYRRNELAPGPKRRQAAFEPRKFFSQLVGCVPLDFGDDAGDADSGVHVEQQMYVVGHHLLFHDRVPVLFLLFEYQCFEAFGHAAGQNFSPVLWAKDHVVLTTIHDAVICVVRFIRFL